MTLNLRKASEAPFPYGWPGIVMYAVIESDGRLAQAPRTRSDFRDVVQRAIDGEVQLIAAWPGEYRTDLFEIDDPERLGSVLGLTTPKFPEPEWAES